MKIFICWLLKMFIYLWPVSIGRSAVVYGFFYIYTYGNYQRTGACCGVLT